MVRLVRFDGMDPRKTTLERAFELARLGECKDVTAICQRLKIEGYDGRQIEGAVLRRQLRALIASARSAKDERGEAAPEHRDSERQDGPPHRG